MIGRHGIMFAALCAAFAGPLAGFPVAAMAADTGLASFYGRDHAGRKSASGRYFDMNAMTAAHKSLPFGTKIMVTNLGNGRSVVVEIADRGPFGHGRIVDVSYAAAEKLGFVRQGVAKVRIDKL